MSALHFRPATADDARFVARHVLEALHWHMYEVPLSAAQTQTWDELTEVCRRDDVLYSHRHALLAEIDGEPVGLILAYDGAHYHSLRTRTFALLPAFAGMDVDSMEDEATVGEYYIDSLAAHTGGATRCPAATAPHPAGRSRQSGGTPALCRRGLSRKRQRHGFRPNLSAHATLITRPSPQHNERAFIPTTE